MKKLISILSLLILCPYGYGQKIQYSRSTFRVDDPDQTQLVSNIRGYHHILNFAYNKRPTIYVFSPDLQLREKKELDLTIKKEADVKLLSFQNHYFIYIHFFKPSTNELWKVDKMGNSVRLSNQFNKVLDSFFTNYTSILQLTKIDDDLYVSAIRYYDSIKTAQSIIVQLDSELNPLQNSTLLFPFDKYKEWLPQTSLTRSTLYVLKNVIDQEEGNTLDIFRIDLSSGKTVTNSFKAGSNFFLNPRFVLNERDSSIIVYAAISGDRIDRTIFVGKLNNQLQEQLPLAVLKSQFKKNTLSNFLFVRGEQPLWLKVYGNTRILRTTYGSKLADTFGLSEKMIRYYGNNYSLNYNQTPGVRFTILDKQFNLEKDSLVANDKKIIEIQPGPSGQFMMNDKSYLVLVQNFTRKHKGLLLITASDHDNFSVTPLPVYARSDYLLNQLQFNGTYFIVPYYTKTEMGLMKITMQQTPD